MKVIVWRLPKNKRVLPLQLLSVHYAVWRPCFNYSKAIKIYPIAIKVYFYFCLAFLGEENFKKVIRAKETLMVKLWQFYPFRLFRLKI